jgi:hypothetical protein
MGRGAIASNGQRRRGRGTQRLGIGPRLQHGEAGVDLRRFPPPRRAVPRRVPRVLGPRQVHQLQHRLRPATRIPAVAGGGGGDVNAADGVGAGRVRVGARGGRGAQRGGAAGEPEELAGRGDGDLPARADSKREIGRGGGGFL